MSRRPDRVKAATLGVEIPINRMAAAGGRREFNLAQDSTTAY